MHIGESNQSLLLPFTSNPANTMKGKIFFCALLLLGYLNLSAAVAALEVRAIYSEGPAQYVSIFDLTNQSSHWIKVGAPFEHWRATRLDNKSLILIGDMGEEKLPLTKGDIRQVTQKEILSRESALKILAESLTAAPVVSSVRTAEDPEVRTLANIPDDTLAAMADPKAITITGKNSSIRMLHFTREVLPIELSANLTDSDIDALNQQVSKTLSGVTTEVTSTLGKEIIAAAEARRKK